MGFNFVNFKVIHMKSKDPFLTPPPPITPSFLHPLLHTPLPPSHITLQPFSHTPLLSTALLADLLKTDSSRYHTPQTATCHDSHKKVVVHYHGDHFSFLSPSLFFVFFLFFSFLLPFPLIFNLFFSHRITFPSSFFLFQFFFLFFLLFFSSLLFFVFLQ